MQEVDPVTNKCAITFEREINEQDKLNSDLAEETNFESPTDFISERPYSPIDCTIVVIR